MFGDERESVAITRLHALVHKGYRPTLGSESPWSDVIHLEHRRGAPKLFLYPDGMIVSLDECKPLHKAEKNSDRIFAYEEGGSEKFSAFLDIIPRLTWLDKISAITLGKAAFSVVFWSTMLVLGGLFGWLFSLLADLVRQVL